MALSWGTPVKIIDAVTIAAGAASSLSTEVDLDSCVGVVGFSIQKTFNASATYGAVISVYPSYDGTNFASTAVEVAYLSVTGAGGSSEEHVYFPISCRKMKVKVSNSSSTYSLTGVSVWAHKQTFSE